MYWSNREYYVNLYILWDCRQFVPVQTCKINQWYNLYICTGSNIQNEPTVQFVHFNRFKYTKWTNGTICTFEPVQMGGSHTDCTGTKILNVQNYLFIKLYIITSCKNMCTYLKCFLITFISISFIFFIFIRGTCKF